MTVEEFLGISGQPSQPRKFSKSERESLEKAFLDAWKVIGHGLPMPSLQHKFHPVRKWRLDFAFVEQKLGVEIQGGAFSSGGHSRGAGQAKDHQKINEAQKLGWMILQYGTKAMGDPYAVALEVSEVLKARMLDRNETAKLD